MTSSTFPVLSEIPATTPSLADHPQLHHDPSKETAVVQYPLSSVSTSSFSSLAECLSFSWTSSLHASAIILAISHQTSLLEGFGRPKMLNIFAAASCPLPITWEVRVWWYRKAFPIYFRLMGMLYVHVFRCKCSLHAVNDMHWSWTTLLCYNLVCSPRKYPCSSHRRFSPFPNLLTLTTNPSQHCCFLHRYFMTANHRILKKPIGRSLQRS